MALADKFPRLKRLAPLILVAGFGAAYLVASPHMAKEHKIKYRFTRAPSEVTELAASWSSIDPSDEDTVAGVRFNFEAGKAPRELDSKVTLRDGEYFVELTVLGTGEPQWVKRRVKLDDRETTIILP